MNFKDFVPLLAPIIGLIPVLLKWWSDRSKEAASQRMLAQAKEQIDFWRVWLQAQREVVSDERFEQLKNEVSQRFDDLVLTKVALENKEKIKEGETEDHSFLQKIFLLYLPKTASGWIFHTLYYITVSLTFLLIWGASIPEENTQNQVSSWAQMKNEVTNNWGMFVFIFLIIVIFQRLARRSEIRAKKKTILKEN